jgi:hypothetical protein
LVNEIHVLLSFSETRKWRREFLTKILGLTTYESGGGLLYNIYLLTPWSRFPLEKLAVFS